MPAIFFAAGIAFSEGPIWALVATAVIWCYALRIKRLTWLPALTLCFLLGGFTASHRTPGPDPQMDAEAGEVVLLAGCIAGPVADDGLQLRFSLEVDTGAKARVTLTSKPGEALPALSYGEQVEIEARIRKPRNYGNPGAFDFAGYLRRDHVYWLASARGASKLKQLHTPCGSPLRRHALALRTLITTRIRSLTDNDDLMPALLVGDNSFLDKTQTADFRATGTYHAIVVSGLHITVVAGTALALMRLAGVPLSALIAAGAAFAWLYAGVADFQPPVVRSAVGFSLFLFATWFHRKGRLLNLLGLTAILLLLWDPSAVYDPSFQLTFLSVAAIGTLASPLVDRTFGPCRDGSGFAGQQFQLETALVAETFSVPVKWLQRALGGIFAIAEMIVISACVQLALLVPSLMYFHQISATAIMANVIVVPVLSAAVPIGLLAALTGLRPLAWWAVHMTAFAKSAVVFFSTLEPGLRFPDIPVALQAALLVSAGLFGAALLLRTNWGALVATGTMATGLAILAVTWTPQVPRGSLELSLIDVGQGDSMLVVFPDGRTLLMDAGGFPVFDKRLKSRFDIGEDVVSPYLWRMGLRRLDYVAVSHLHDDHAAGLPAVIRNFRPREIWTGLAPENSPLLAKMREAAWVAGSRVVAMHEGDTRDYVRVIWPRADALPGPHAKNDDSLVLLLTHGKHRFLLMGDGEKKTELGMQIPEEVDVLKAGHHGSKTSSRPEFLQVVRPLFAMIGVGNGNSYGHPSPQVLDSFRENGTRVLRTDEDGLVQVRSDGTRLRIWRNRDGRPSEYPALSGGGID
ncbi:MAG: DNA internalization-related competence protein ComEC/Rec2 [Bryobacteraceae bacterium]|nr:DNA internalization-related competence protein ComEC/Rec2 [Bryobacteraceae bacterium]